MQIYRRKAVEKEQKRRKKHSHNLLSKVENLLENADVRFVNYIFHLLNMKFFKYTQV